MWLMSLAWRALSVSWLVLLIAVRDSGVSLGASCRPCRLEVVSEGLLQVALAGDLAGLRDGDFRSLALEGWCGGRLAPRARG